MLNSDVRDGKKGSIGFTLAASLVKWKINTLKAAKKANETIAKVKQVIVKLSVSQLLRFRKRLFSYLLTKVDQK